MRILCPDLRHLHREGNNTLLSEGTRRAVASPPPLKSNVLPFNHHVMDHRHHPIFALPRSPPHHHRRLFNPRRLAPRAPRRPPIIRGHSPHRFLHDDLARLVLGDNSSDHSDSDFEAAPTPPPSHHHHGIFDRRGNSPPHQRRRRGGGGLPPLPFSPPAMGPVMLPEEIRLRALVRNHPNGRRLPITSPTEVYLLPPTDYRLPITMMRGNSTERPVHLMRAVIPGCFTSSDLLKAIGLRPERMTMHGGSPLVEDGYRVLLVTFSGHSLEMASTQRLDSLVRSLQGDRPVEVVVQPRGSGTGFLG